MSKKKAQEAKVISTVKESLTTEPVIEASVEQPVAEALVEHTDVVALVIEESAADAKNPLVLGHVLEEAPIEERVVHSEHGALYMLEESAQILIDNFSPGWLPSIQAYARSHGAHPEAPLPYWRWLFQSWGAVIKRS